MVDGNSRELPLDHASPNVFPLRFFILFCTTVRTTTWTRIQVITWTRIQVNYELSSILLHAGMKHTSNATHSVATSSSGALLCLPVLTSGAEVDYWEEVTLEDGSVCFYNHTGQEYSSSLPSSNEATTPIDEEGPAKATNGNEPKPAGTAESNNESQLGMWEGQVWDGVDGEVFVPWLEEESHAMKTSPEAAVPTGELPDTPEGEVVQTTSLCVQSLNPQLWHWTRPQEKVLR